MLFHQTFSMSKSLSLTFVLQTMTFQAKLPSRLLKSYIMVLKFSQLF